ncbi:hypothetical protein KAR91_20885 [Candidatus Pacearchaeota archaeon]|nr:hypothetical protein [Candidatus Pacearchaeota archaeon]
MIVIREYILEPEFEFVSGDERVESINVRGYMRMLSVVRTSVETKIHATVDSTCNDLNIFHVAQVRTGEDMSRYSGWDFLDSISLDDGDGACHVFYKRVGSVDG